MFYEENRHLEEEDIGFDTPVYHITLYDNPFLIAIGKERKLIQKKNTYYFPIYLLNKTQVQSQIGAFEFESSKDTTAERIKPFLDNSGDIDVNRLGDPVLYSFASYDYFQALTNSITPVGLKELEVAYMEQKVKVATEEEEEEIPEEEPRPFELTTEDIRTAPSSEISKANNVLKNGVFTINKMAKRIQSLSEENKEDAHKLKEAFIENAKSKWIEKYMKNNNYEIVDTLSNGDCFFDTVKTAYEQIGYETTIQKLRALVAKEVTKERFMEYRELYQSTLAEITETDKELRRLVTENKNLKERLTSIPTTEKKNRDEVIKQANAIRKKHTELKEKQQMNRSFLEEFAHMKQIDTLEKFREFVQTPSYWADDWAIDVLERELNMKMIVFSSNDYEEDDENNVLRCTLSSQSSNGDFIPDFYIMTTYSGDHYRLISYSNKRIFTFREIPYDVKTMIVIKCMEKNSGVFSKIPDFKEYKRKLGLENSDDENDEEEMKGGGDTSKNTVFVFYNKSNGSYKPGKASNEKILPENIHEYSELALSHNKDWRKKLDDDWASTFTLDNKKWKTVEHYYQATKFKKHNPHFYKQFSLDDNASEIAKDVELAKAAGSQKGVFKRGKKQIPLRPIEIRIDPDFYGSRQKEERERALYAKFSQNEELKQMLLATKTATLKQYVPKQKATIDHSLMDVRSRL